MTGGCHRGPAAHRPLTRSVVREHNGGTGPLGTRSDSAAGRGRPPAPVLG